MGSARHLITGLFAVVACLAVMSSVQVRAHGGGNWEPFTIDGVNNNARIEVSKVHTLMAVVIRGRSGADEWPVDGMQEMRDALLTIKEVVDEVIEHYVIDGIDVQTAATLHDHPRAGRTVAASRALAAGIAIIEHAASLDSADDFITEFYAGDMAARLFELLEVNTDRMDLYAAMTENAEQLRVPDSLPE